MNRDLFEKGKQRWLPTDPSSPQAWERAQESYLTAARAAYETRAKELLDELKTLEIKYSHKNLSRQERKRAVDCIADYYQVMVNAQLFDGVNNSIAMAQVNFMLHRFGYEPIEHRRLDYLAYISPTPVMRRVFHKVIDERGYPLSHFPRFFF